MLSKSTKSNSMKKKSSSKQSKSNKLDNTNDVNENSSKISEIVKPDLTTTDLFRLADFHFNKKNYIFRHLYDSYNKFIEEDVKNYLENSEHVFSESLTPTTYYRYRFKYENVRIEEPMMTNGIEPLYPSDARHNRLTYSLKTFANVTQYQDTIDVISNQKTTTIVGTVVSNFHIGTIPLMVRSKWCSLINHKDSIKNECEYDPGGYFIVNGNEKVVISQDSMVENKPLVFIKKDSGTMTYVVQINSRSYKYNGITQVMNVKIRKDGVMLIRVPILNEVNVCAVLRALGMGSDKDIIDYITYDSHDTDMIDIIRLTLDACKGEKGIKISTEEEAIDYLLPKIRAPKKYTESDKETKQQQKKMHLLDLLQRSFLPHVDANPKMKAYFLCYMLNRVLRAYLGRIPVDDRDSYINKRVLLPGDLMMELYKHQHKKIITESKKYFENRNKSDVKPINIIANLKINIIEQGFKASLSTGRWIRRQGVAQVLNRLSYLQTISFLHRVDAPSGDASSAKLTNPRHLHASGVGFLCVTGDSEILMNDGCTVKLIKDLKNGDDVVSTYKEDLREIKTPITNYFSKMSDNLLELTTISGRTLKCTHDHPILILDEHTNTYVMKDAGKITENDKVIIRHCQKYLELDKNIDIVIRSSDNICDEYVNDLKIANLYNVKIPQEKLEIFARLVGSSVTDGHINKRKISTTKYPNQYEARFCVGEESDALEIFDDIQKLGFGSSCIGRQTTKHTNKQTDIDTFHNTWTVSKGGIFAYLLVYFGAFVGNKTEQIKTIPEWILNGNNRIKREFLSGFHGGDGCRISAQSNGNTFKMSIGRTCQTSSNKYINATVDYMTNIKNMFEEFGIIGSVSTHDYSDDKKQIKYAISQSYENLEMFADCIGFRYCNEKRRASAPVIEYIKYKRYIANEKTKNYNTIIELYNKGYTPSQIVKETQIEHQVVKRILENVRKGNIPKSRETDSNTLKYNEFVNNYYLKENHLAVPISQILNRPPEVVYDFETRLDSHTLVANSFVISNCCSQTPEHARVGLTKHLTLIASVSLMSRDQFYLLKTFLQKNTINVLDISPIKLHNVNMYKVFLNGDWIGVTEKFIELHEKLHHMKLHNEIDHQNVSIVIDHDNGEIKVYCDSGRMFRPVFTVNGNRLNITKKHIDMISLNKANHLKKITDFDEFVIKNPELIEYIDMELQPYVMISDKQKTLDIMYNKLVNSVELSKHVKTNHVDNRYDEMFYVKYSHCEIHPALLIGEIIANIPFLDHNVGPRVIFAYAQGRQAMGIYATNYRDRLDISYILYHPQRPLVSTRTARYTNSELLPAGENCIVAISCFTGYNQEDSLIFNKTSIERGKFRGMYLKKYLVSVQKNQTTLQDDIFMKPDPNKVSNMRSNNVDKLNDKGYPPEETKLENGDIIFGKCTPNSDPDAKKPFKDSSEIYKTHTSGVVDRMYIDIPNSDGYLTREALIRSERTPRIGDKYSCYTDDHEVLTTNGWIPINKITTNHKVASLIDGNTLKYVNPTATQEYDFDGQMYSIKSNQVDLFVTPNHRMYVGNRNGGNFSVKTADQCYGKRWTYKKNVDKYEFTGDKSGFINYDNYTFVLPAFNDKPKLEVPLDLWLKFFGIWIAEGCTLRDYGVSIATHKERVKNELEIVCSAMGFKIQKHKDKKYDNDRNAWICSDKRIVNYIKPLSVGAINKSLPNWTWELKPLDCKTLIDGMMLGDGHTMKNGTRRYDTSSTQLADDFQRLCLHAGYSTNKTLKYEAGHVAKGKTKTITSTTNAYRLTIIESQNTPLVNKNIKPTGENRHDEWIDYNGKVYCCTVPDSGVIYVKRNGVPVWCGQSRHGQKGTIGIALDANDMLFTKDGIVPDIVVNSNAIPSRMTIGQLAECMIGKLAAIKGMDADGTIFEEHDFSTVHSMLKNLGYDEYGYDEMYNGMTGEKLKTKVFIGPTFYQRLKHLVEDKIHSRARGINTSLTRQAPEGRSRDGGLRLGEMERDALLGHGLAKFIKEKLLDNSDAYTTFTCDRCGLFATRVDKDENKTFATENDTYYCPSCNNYTDINKVKIPYAFKLFLHELTAMCVAPRIRCTKTIYNS